MPKFDPYAFIQGLIQDPAGWSLGQIELATGPAPRNPMQGLRGPDGAAWEAVPINWQTCTKRDFKFMSDRLRYAAQAGYEQVVVQLDGQWWAGERMRPGQFQPFDGLTVLGEWRDGSCSGHPWQHTLPVKFRDENLTLYIRWRWHDPWTGCVIRYDSDVDPHGFLHSHWSPNLLPTEPPPDEPAPTRLLDLLGQPPRPEPWIAEDETEKAQRVIQAKAEAWLREHYDTWADAKTEQPG